MDRSYRVLQNPKKVSELATTYVLNHPTDLYFNQSYFRVYWVLYDALTFNFHLKHPVFCHDEDIKELLELDLLEKRLSNGYSFSDKQQSSKTQTATKSAL